MRLAIMQPYFFPYIGYFQLISAVDVFVIYDNIKYTKKGWINRNRMLQNGKDAMFSLPLKKGSDYLDVRERELAADFNRDKLLNQFEGAYRRAPHFQQVFPLIEEVVRYEDSKLSGFLYNAIVKTCKHLEIATELRISSSIAIDHDLKNQDKVLALCKVVNANIYVNAIGGMVLYSKESFREQGVQLQFIKSRSFEYAQFGDKFVPWLSIIDALMFCPRKTVVDAVEQGYDLI